MQRKRITLFLNPVAVSLLAIVSAFGADGEKAKVKGEVKGFADASGSAVMNQKLSEDRAVVVVAYFIQLCYVPVRRIVAPGAMGENQPAASNESKEGRSQNRRVEAKVLVNKGIAGT